jgi:hypothetical protein
MTSTPSIKGSVFAGVVEDVKKLLTTGQLSKTDAARWLQSDDLPLLDQNILVSHWYDLRSYTRMTELLREVEGDGSNDYLRQRGRKTARRLLEAGLYAQFEYLQRAEVAKETDAQARFEAFGRDLRLLTTISGSILNFSRWAAKPEQGKRLYRIEVTEARDIPEVLCWTSDGFVNGMVIHHAGGDLWRWERPSPDLVVFRMHREI